MTDEQPRLFQIWLDASDGSIATYDGVQWPDGTADVHHRYRRPDGVQWPPQALAETIHGKLGRVEWTPNASAGLQERAEQAEAQVARIRNFLEDMAGWCSPRGIAADYARRGLDALDGVDPLGKSAGACSCGRSPDPGICPVRHSDQRPAGGHCACACNKEKP